MIDASTFVSVVARLRDAGFADDDIAWSENCQLPADAADFASEAILVICNSGMKNTVARRIYDRCMGAISRGESACTVFGHPGKAAAIDRIWKDRERLFVEFGEAPDKVEFCAGLPWIGNITKYHLAKNFGTQVAKPDVHLQRLADLEGCSAQTLCERLASACGYKVATVDLLLWRACAVGVLNSRTGAMQ